MKAKLSLILLLYGLFSCNNKEAVVLYKNIDTVSCNIEEQIYNYIHKLNIAHLDIVYMQARVESANFTSTVFLKNNNIFGMKKVERRPTTQIGACKHGYGIYENWKMSVIDYALLQAWSYKNLSEEEYLKQLKASYAEDSNYVKKLK